MLTQVAALSSLEDLRRYVLQTLCDYDRLDPNQTPLFQSVMTRSRRPCGLYFLIQGPRQLRTTALWISDEHRILFYDSTGMRVAETRLSDAPAEVLKAAA
jgi:hypothetical protein